MNKDKLIAEAIQTLNRSEDSEEAKLEDLIEFYEDKNQVLLNYRQRKAVKMVFQNNLSIIVGGPGTGKSTILDIVLCIAKHEDKKILLAAPTGKAAQRMEESTGFPAKTIHDHLGYDGQRFNQNHLDADLIVIDEASMIDTEVGCALLKAIPKKARVVFVGDNRQLPPVGDGNVFSDMCQTTAIHKTFLNQVMRQDGESSIAINAARIRRNNPDIVFDENFVFVEKDTSEAIAEEVMSRFIELSQKSSCLILSPYRSKTVTGTDQLNKMIVREIKKGAANHVVLDGKFFFNGERVIFSRNMKRDKLSVKNGETGVIKIDKNKNITFINDDTKEEKNIDINDESLVSEMEPGYALTIHKSQGSEAANVIIVIDKKHKNMMTLNLLYTAITRAKKKVVLIGSRAAFDECIKKGFPKVPKTALRGYLEEI